MSKYLSPDGKFKGSVGLLLIAAVTLAPTTWLELRVVWRSSWYPEELTLKELIARGPGGNPHVVVTDFDLSDEVFFFHYQQGDMTSGTDSRKQAEAWNAQGAGHSSEWIEVAVPITPHGADGVSSPNKVEAVLTSGQTPNIYHLNRLMARPKVRVLVSNGIRSLCLEQLDLMIAHPETDMKTCLILDLDRQPATPWKLLLLGGGCVLCFLFSGWLLVGAFRDLYAAVEERKRKR